MKIIVIVGSTGVGKTDFALELAQCAPIEIINADLGQFYEPFSIGTAKPDWKNSTVPHHLFDIVTTPSLITAYNFRLLVKKIADEIIARGNVPVLVGGSTFYVESLFFELPHVSLINNVVSKESYNAKDTNDLWQELNAIDALRAQHIHHNDRYRIIRALQQWHQTGMRPSDLKPVFNPLYPFEYIYLKRERDDLYDRINQRVSSMLQAGWLDEIRDMILNTPWEQFVMEKKFIGYPDLINYCKNNDVSSLQTVSALIAQKTRNYAKRQETYWRRLEKKIYNCLVTTPEYTNTQASCITSYNITSNSSKTIINQMCNTIGKKK